MTIEERIGASIRTRRLELGMSQSALADRVGVRFQQIQKYEGGRNRVAASRLWAISRVLEVPMCYFFEDEAEMAAELEDRELHQLAALYASLDQSLRRKALVILRGLAA